MTAVDPAGFSKDALYAPIHLESRRAHARPSPAPMAELLSQPHKWRDEPLTADLRLQWIDGEPGIYAISGPVMTTAAHQLWDGVDVEPTARGVAVDARQAEVWVTAARNGTSYALRLAGAEVRTATCPTVDWALPRPPWDVWNLEDQPGYLTGRTRRDADGDLVDRAIAVGRLLARWSHGSLAAVIDHDPLERLRRWWRAVPSSVRDRIDALSAQRARKARPGVLSVMHLLDRDDLACLSRLLKTDGGHARRLDRRLQEVDRHPDVFASASLDPQLTTAASREDHPWWAQ